MAFKNKRTPSWKQTHSFLETNAPLTHSTSLKTKCTHLMKKKAATARVHHPSILTRGISRRRNSFRSNEKLIGTAKFTIVDKHIPLIGAQSIVGRAVVVHADADDLGKGGHELSKSTGNAGGRVACGIIGLQG